MGKYVMRDAYIAINGTPFSDHASSLTLEDTANEVEFTAFTANAYREFGQGLKDATVTATFFADFAPNSIHAALEPLYRGGGTFNLEMRPTADPVGTANPKATMVARLYAYSGIAGAVGEAATFEASFRNAGTAGVTWSTT
jgi:hypothetical protein